MLNRVTLIGRLARDPELRTTSTGKNLVHFTVAVAKRIRPTDGSPEADFFHVKAWGKTAEYVGGYLEKGRMVAVDGRIESRRYRDGEGNEREIWEVVADTVNGLDRPREESAAPSRAIGASH
jgi:single-strand DNA-binding protein